MERFLTELYQEEMDKTAEVELEEALVAQPLEVLEAMLGIRKHAVAGPAQPVLPTPHQGKVLDARQKAVDEFSAKNRVETPPTREQAAAATHTNDDGEQKKVAMVWADRMGRKLAGVMDHVKDFGRGALGSAMMIPALGRELIRPETISRAGTLGMLAVPAATIGGTAALAHHLGKRSGQKQKQSQGVGDSGGMGAEGGGAGQGIETTGSMDGGAEMTTTASMKAKIASIALRATRGAPDHIRKTAAAVAGQKIAAVGEQGIRPFRFGG